MIYNMRTLILYIVSIISINCMGQIKDVDYSIPKRDYSTALKTIGLYTASITLDAVGDALMDSGNKGWGHICNATSTGILVSTPFVIDFNKKQWPWYAAAYIFMRAAIFDIVYNLTRGLAWNYHGDTSGWDNVWGAINPPAGAELFGRCIILSLAITIPLQNIK